MTESTVRRLAHVFSMVADLEADSVRVIAMTASGGYCEEDFMVVSDRMAGIAKELRSLGGVECLTGDANDVREQ